MTKRKEKTPEDSMNYIAEIVGEESLFGERMGAGKLLHMMDFAAASAAVKHAESALVTLAFDRVELTNMIGQVVLSQDAGIINKKMSVDIDVSNLEAGIYLYTVSVGSERISNRMIVK